MSNTNFKVISNAWDDREISIPVEESPVRNVYNGGRFTVPSDSEEEEENPQTSNEHDEEIPESGDEEEEEEEVNDSEPSNEGSIENIIRGNVDNEILESSINNSLDAKKLLTLINIAEETRNDNKRFMTLLRIPVINHILRRGLSQANSIRNLLEIEQYLDDRVAIFLKEYENLNVEQQYFVDLFIKNLAKKLGLESEKDALEIVLEYQQNASLNRIINQNESNPLYQIGGLGLLGAILATPSIISSLQTYFNSMAHNKVYTETITDIKDDIIPKLADYVNEIASVKNRLRVLEAESSLFNFYSPTRSEEYRNLLGRLEELSYMENFERSKQENLQSIAWEASKQIQDPRVITAAQQSMELKDRIRLAEINYDKNVALFWFLSFMVTFFGLLFVWYTGGNPLKRNKEKEEETEAEPQTSEKKSSQKGKKAITSDTKAGPSGSTRSKKK